MKRPDRINQHAHVSPGALAPALPRVRILMQVKHGKHRDQVIVFLSLGLGLYLMAKSIAGLVEGN